MLAFQSIVVSWVTQAVDFASSFVMLSKVTRIRMSGALANCGRDVLEREIETRSHSVKITLLLKYQEALS